MVELVQKYHQLIEAWLRAVQTFQLREFVVERLDRTFQLMEQEWRLGLKLNRNHFRKQMAR